MGCMDGGRMNTKEQASVTGLRPCPFCKSIRLELVTVVEPDRQPICIMCADCGATGPSAESVEALRDAWGMA